MDKLVEEIKVIARKAGEAIMTIYQDESLFEVQEKTDSSPLTKADLLANDVIVAGLEKLDKQYPIISEENKLLSYDERKSYTKCWMVDPLDGTKEFIKRNGEFTVNIALIADGAPILGVIYVPVTEQMFWAIKNKGAYTYEDGKVVKMLANEFTLADDSLRVVCSRSHVNEPTQAYIDKLSSPETVACGSSLKFTTIANGGAEVYPRIGPTMEWDTAAAQIILEEAGGTILRFDDNQPLQYNKENLLNPNFVAMGRLQS